MSLLIDLRMNFPIINVFSGSEADNPFYSLVIPKILINARVSKKGLKRSGSWMSDIKNAQSCNPRSNLSIANASPLLIIVH